MDKYDINKLQRQALGAYLDAIERGSGVAIAKEGLAVVEGLVERWLFNGEASPLNTKGPVGSGPLRIPDGYCQSEVL